MKQSALFITITILLSLLIILHDDAPPAAASKPNIVIIALDALRADFLGAYGCPWSTSPTIDRLARRGILFTQARCQSTHTFASVGSLFTGMLPDESGVVFKDASIPKEIPPMAASIARAGYRSVCFSANPNVSRTGDFARGFHEFRYLPPDKSTHPDGEAFVSADELNQALLRRRRFAFSSQPLFLYLHYLPPHNPYAPPAPFPSMFTDGYQGPYDGSTQSLLEIENTHAKLTPADLDHLKGLYAANIRAGDKGVADLLLILREVNVLSNCWLIFTADHGEAFREHQHILHSTTVYEEMARIPMIIVPPEGASGRIDETLVALMDLYPTALELAGADETPPHLTARSFASRLKAPAAGPAQPSEDRLIYTRAMYSKHYRSLAGLRYKLIFHERRDRAYLYDLESDPGEQSDIARDKPKITKRYLKELKKIPFVASNKDQATTESEEKQEALRALGYVD